MSETVKHTPGPWTLGSAHGTSEKLFHVWRQKDRPLTDWVATVFDNGLVSALEADARLIAAAPDLLEALELVRSIIAEGAAVGFNPLDGGDWAERLYRSQSATAAAVKLAGGNTHARAISQENPNG